MTNVALASAVFGMFSSVIFLTPLAGAFLSDRWLGRTRAILIGGGLLVAGTLMLMAPAAFVIGLLFILIGFGLFGGNLTAQLGNSTPVTIQGAATGSSCSIWPSMPE
jgi:POT family proton-dependent oligopeptide transporter